LISHPDDYFGLLWPNNNLNFVEIFGQA